MGSFRSVATPSCRACGGRQGIPGFDEACRAAESLREQVLCPA